MQILDLRQLLIWDNELTKTIMKKIIKRILICLLLIFVVIQFFRPEKNKTNGVSAHDITTKYTVPPDVQNILQTACYDCHSNNTVYPWYAEVQPVGWWLSGHIKDGKSSLNFSEFTEYKIRKQYRKLEEVNDLVKSGAMPLSSYTWIHTDAKLSDDQKLLISKWTATLMDQIKANNPPDSLIKR